MKYLIILMLFSGSVSANSMEDVYRNALQNIEKAAAQFDAANPQGEHKKQLLTSFRNAAMSLNEMEVHYKMHTIHGRDRTMQFGAAYESFKEALTEFGRLIKSPSQVRYSV